MLALLVKSDKKTLFSTKSLKFYNIAKNKVRIFCKYTPEIAPRLLREKIYEKISSVMNLVRYIAPLLYIRFFESYNIFFSHFCRGPQFFLDLLFTPMVFEFFSTSNFLEISQKARMFSQLSDWFPNLSGGFVDFLENSLPQKPNSNNNMDSLNKSWLKKKINRVYILSGFFFTDSWILSSNNSGKSQEKW